jgi:Cu(I)/Ag(I) efflux system membrane fusion protein
MQIASIDKLWFISKVYQSDLSFISKNQEAKIKIDGIDMSFKTKVDYIYPIADNKTKTIDVRFEIDNKDLKLFPNMFGKASIKSSSIKMLTLPNSAVLTKGDKYYVFKPISADEFEPVVVEARRISSSKYEIEEGLNVGDEVINNALFLLDSDAVTNNLYDDEDTDW